MKLFILVFFVFGIYGCSNTNSNIIYFEAGDKIDLSNIDSVRENLNGFWINEVYIDKNYIEWFDFDKNRNTSSWDFIPYNENDYQDKVVPISTCSSIVELLKLNNRVHLNVVGMGGSDTIKIESLNENRLEIGKTIYLRHRGYDFMDD